MFKKWILPVSASFVVSMLLDFVVHALLLAGDYARLPQLYRNAQDAQAYFPYMLCAHVLIAVGVVWIYQRGLAATPWFGQGLRFGAALALVTALPNFLIYYAVQPLPSDLVLRQLAFGGIAMLLLGVAVAWLHRGHKQG